MRKRFLWITALVAAASVAGAGIVFAAGAAWPTRGGANVAVTATGGGTGAGCGTAFQTREDLFLPDNIDALEGEWDDLSPASQVTFLKKCHGGAMATFSSETVAEQIQIPGGPSGQDVDNDDIVAIVRATCTHPLPNIANPCHTGDTVYGSPGGYGDPVYFDLAPDIAEVHSMQWAFPSLKPGMWTIEVLPANLSDEPNSGLEYRTLHVETL